MAGGGSPAFACRTCIIPGLLRLARYFGNSPQFWLNLQAAYDLEVATRLSVEPIQRDVRPPGAA
jgi:plasmid maintenance system antidote protein VapI